MIQGCQIMTLRA